VDQLGRTGAARSPRARRAVLPGAEESNCREGLPDSSAANGARRERSNGATGVLREENSRVVRRARDGGPPRLDLANRSGRQHRPARGPRTVRSASFATRIRSSTCFEPQTPLRIPGDSGSLHRLSRGRRSLPTLATFTNTQRRRTQGELPNIGLCHRHTALETSTVSELTP
jgi:hypothetical protein